MSLWSRWFDTREYRRAHREALAAIAELRAENKLLRSANTRLAVAVDTCEREHR